jgi:hypothetical protein
MPLRAITTSKRPDDFSAPTRAMASADQRTTPGKAVGTRSYCPHQE